MISKCHVLRVAAIGVFAIAIPQYASALDPGHDAAMKLAMGPTSAAPKNQYQASKKSSDISGMAVAKPHHGTKHERSAH